METFARSLYKPIEGEISLCERKSFSNGAENMIDACQNICKATQLFPL